MSWLSLFLFIIMLAIIFFQTIHGTFSAIIMAVLTVLSATLALSLHEMLAEDMLAAWVGDYAYPLALGGIFAVALFILRLVVDRFISRSTLIPSMLDKAGSVVFGAVTGLVATGIMGLSIQMIPWGPTIMGFERYDKKGNPHHNLWLNPDKFTVNLCGYLSDRTLVGERSWFRSHPDFVSELHWYRDSDAVGSRITVKRDSIRVQDVGLTTELYDYKAQKNVRNAAVTVSEVEGPPPGKRWWVVKVRADEGARDEDSYYRSSPTQARLVGLSEDGSHPEQYVLKGIGFGGRFVTFKHEPFYGNKSGNLDFVFETPEGFQPKFVEFKRSGYAALPSGRLSGELRMLTPTSELTEIVADSSNQGLPVSRPRRGGATTPVRVKDVGTHFGNDLPLTLRAYAGSTTLSGTALKRGRLTLDVSDQQEDSTTRTPPRRRGQDPANLKKDPIDSLLVPGDLQLLQLNTEAVIPSSVWAGAINAARRALKQYRVHDNNGRHYWPAGLIAECEVGGKRLMEIQYFPEDAIDFDRTQIRDLSQFGWADLKGDYQLIFLFVVPRGTEIVEFNSGNKVEDLRALNLVAPS